MWRTNFEFLAFFSWSWQWCRKRRQITNLFWTTFLSINIQRYLNFGAFYYIIDNFGCCSKFKCWREIISQPHFDPQEHYIYTLIYICLFTLFVYIIICLLFLGGRGGRSGISKPRNLRGFRDASGQLVFDPDDENLSDKELYARNIPAIGRIKL